MLQNLLDCGHAQSDLVIAVDVLVEDMDLDALVEVGNNKVMGLVPRRIDRIVLGLSLPRWLGTYVDLAVTIGRFTRKLGKQFSCFALRKGSTFISSFNNFYYESINTFNFLLMSLFSADSKQLNCLSY